MHERVLSDRFDVMIKVTLKVAAFHEAFVDMFGSLEAAPRARWSKLEHAKWTAAQPSEVGIRVTTSTTTAITIATTTATITSTTTSIIITSISISMGIGG